MKRLRQIVCVLSVLLLGASLAPAANSANGPQGLPDHLGIGLVASNDASGIAGWMPQSKVPWDYAYQYLAGGANTGQGWSTWNDKGQFPLYYAKAAASHGYIPVFSYYQLLSSKASCAACGEGDKDVANLKDPAAMKAYYDDFALLMKRLGNGTYDGIQGFGQTAIVHVEPDLSGFVQHAAQFDDPTTVPAAVSSSGQPDVQQFPNTYQGFNWALLHLRDLYAPNVLLAFHVSPWSSSVDIGSSHDPSLDAAGIGARTGAFAAESGTVHAGPGTSTYDLLFTDGLDRDAGLYKYAQGDPSRWWDKLNLTYPNFQRWEMWLGSAAQSAGRKPVFVWQIPLGNQYFQSQNNTPGHYQDNRAEYFLSHLDELQQVGIVALLFGRGGGSGTTYTDAANDGVTNPPSFCSSDGMSNGQVCNDHQSTVPDDDGGYIRMAAQQYYAHPLPIGVQASTPTTVASPQSVPTSPGVTDTAVALQVDLGASSIDPVVAAPGQDVELRQNTIANIDATVRVEFELVDARGQQVFESQVPDQRVLLGSVMSTSTTFKVPDDLVDGRYTLKVGVLSNDGATQYARSEAAGILIIR
jgi:hypothetical protein